MGSACRTAARHRTGFPTQARSHKLIAGTSSDSRWSCGLSCCLSHPRYVDRIEEIYRGMRGALIARESGCRVFHRTPPETTRPLQEARASRDRPRRCQSGMLKGSRLAGVDATAPNRHSLGLLRHD